MQFRWSRCAYWAAAGDPRCDEISRGSRACRHSEHRDPRGHALSVLLSSNGIGGVPILAFVLMAVAVVLIVAVPITPAALGSMPWASFRGRSRGGLRVNRVVAGSYVASGVCGGNPPRSCPSPISTRETTGSGDMLLSVVVTLSSHRVLSQARPKLGARSQHALCGFADQRFSASRSLELLGQWNPGRLDPLVVAATSILRPRGKLS